MKGRSRWSKKSYLKAGISARGKYESSLRLEITSREAQFDVVEKKEEKKKKRLRREKKDHGSFIYLILPLVSALIKANCTTDEEA